MSGRLYLRGGVLTVKRRRKETRCRRVRGAAPGALNRVAFATACGVSYNTIRNWEASRRLRPQFTELPGQQRRPWFTREQIAELVEMRFWNSAKGSRLARALFRKRNTDE